jgi:hypothetical protein
MGDNPSHRADDEGEKAVLKNIPNYGDSANLASALSPY